MSTPLLNTRLRQADERKVGDLASPTPAVFQAVVPVSQVIEALRPRVREQLITYVFVVDEAGRLEGVVAMRDLLFADPGQTLGEVMLRAPFRLREDQTVLSAMQEVMRLHFPVYPVCDATDRLLGVVRGADLYKAQAVVITAQAGSMVGVDAEERVATPAARSLRFRHPWLQFNLLTCFVSAAVVHFFEGTISAYVILAVFLPLMVGQATNIGCQSLAVALRGMTLGEVGAGRSRALLRKEAWLGLLNGALSGVTAAAGIYAYASWNGDAHAPWFALVAFLSMTASALLSGLAGAAVPLVLRRFGADPANASSIFLTTIAEVAALGSFLGLAAALIT